jgi:hypothetical protein
MIKKALGFLWERSIHEHNNDGGDLIAPPRLMP